MEILILTNDWNKNYSPYKINIIHMHPYLYKTLKQWITLLFVLWVWQHCEVLNDSAGATDC